MKFLWAVLLSLGVHGAFFIVNPELTGDSNGMVNRILSSLFIGFGLVYGIHYATRKDS